MTWIQIAPTAGAAFLASVVECVEAATIVLAVGTVRGWRSALAGTWLALVVLVALVVALGPALAVETHGKPMGFVTNLLDQVKDRGMVFQTDGLILLPQDIDDFFLLGDARESLIDDFELFERRRRRV